MRRGYSYRPRRRRSRAGPWWLIAPIVVVASVVFLSFRLPQDSGSLLVASVPAGCGVEDGCGAGVAAPVDCGPGCRLAQGGAAVAALSAPANISGRAVAVIEEPCGVVLLDRNSHDPRAPASITKIATAVVAAEWADLDDMVDVNVDGAELAMTTDSTVMGLEPGMRLSLRDLLYGLLLPSGNDAAIAIAEYVGGSVDGFVEMMNAKARALGLQDTHFANPHGLDDSQHYTSAYDITVLARELLRQPELAQIVRTPIYQPAWDGPPLWNGNRLLQLYPDAIGVKIGFTDEAGGTIVAAAERDGRRIVVSVLGSAGIYDDAIRLFDWAFDSVPSACAAS